MTTTTFRKHTVLVPGKGDVTIHETKSPSVWYADSLTSPGVSYRIEDGRYGPQCECPARAKCVHLTALSLLQASAAPAAPPPSRVHSSPPPAPPSKENHMSQAETAPTALAIVPSRTGEEALAVQLHDPAKQALVRQLAPDLSPIEFDLFLEVCRNTGLNPIMRQIHAIVRGSGQNRKVTHQVGIDGYRLLAQRTGQFDGVDGPYWCGPDGEWKDVWLSPEPPVAAKGTVFRKDMTRGFTAVARFDEYAQYTAEWKNNAKTGNQILNSMWGKMPAGQIAKCMWALAYRMAFPAEMSGVYTDEEMGQADNPRETAHSWNVEEAPAAPLAEWSWMDEYKSARAKAGGMKHATVAAFLNADPADLDAIDSYLTHAKTTPARLVSAAADWVAAGGKGRAAEPPPAEPEPATAPEAFDEGEWRDPAAPTDAETRALFDNLDANAPLGTTR